MNRINCTLRLALLLTATAISGLSEDARRIVAQEFDYSSVLPDVRKVFGAEQDIGRGMFALLAAGMAKENPSAAVERAIMRTFGSGSISGCWGTSTRRVENCVNCTGGSGAVLKGQVIIFGLGNGKAVVGLAYSLKDIHNSTTIAVGEVRGESKRRISGWNGMLSLHGHASSGSVRMESTDFLSTIIGEATLDCVNQLIAVLNDSILKTAAWPID